MSQNDLRMTSDQMMYEAKLMYESIASAATRAYSKREWSHILTQAQEDIVTKLINEGVDKSDINRRIVHALFKTVTSTPCIAGNIKYPNGYIVSLNSDILLILNEHARITKNNKVYNNVEIKQISYDSYWANKDNPFKKPNEKFLWRLIYEKNTSNNILRIILITDSSTTIVNSYIIDYIRKPKPIIVSTPGLTEATSLSGYIDKTDCELDSVIHRDIVRQAAKLAAAFNKDQVPYQILTNEQKINEQIN